MDADAWNELWDQLHHQGDVGEASYAAVPLLLEVGRTGPRDWNLYALVATIEVERHRADNPDLPSWIRPEYEAALTEVAELALGDLAETTDSLMIRSAMSVVALARGECRLGALLAWLESSEIEELLEERASWTATYGEPDS